MTEAVQALLPQTNQLQRELVEDLQALLKGKSTDIDTMIVSIESSLYLWSRFFLRHYFKLSTSSSMHYWLCDQLDRMRTERGKLCLLAPRGASKSMFSTLAGALRGAVTGREMYTWVCSDSQTQTRLHLKNIRRECETNERLDALYPGVVGAAGRYSADSITLGNGAVIDGISTGQNPRGRREGADRPTAIYLDDPEGPEDAISPTRRTNNYTWFDGDLLKAGDQQTNFVVLGTAICPDCLVLKVIKQTGIWNSKLYKAIIRWPDRMDLWAAWESILLTPFDGTADATEQVKAKARAYYDERKPVMDAGAELLWPNRYGDDTLYLLMLERAGGHAAFEREHQNSPHNPDACEWPASYFDNPKLWFDYWPRDGVQVRVTGLDPSKGASDRFGDYCGLVNLIYTRDGILWVEAKGARGMKISEVADMVVDNQLEFGPIDTSIEINQFQELFAAVIKLEAERRNVPLNIWPVTNTIKKETRIRQWDTYLRRGLVRFRRTPATRLMVEQFQAFPNGEFDDFPDAGQMAISRAIHYVSGMADGGEPPPSRLRG